MNREDIRRAAEEELSKRFQNQLYGTTNVVLPQSRLSTPEVKTRPGTAPAFDRPPLSSPYAGLHTDSTAVRTTLMQLKRAPSAGVGSRPSTADSLHWQGASTSTRPASAMSAATLLQLHKDDILSNDAKKTGDGSFYERSKFRELYRQLQNHSKKNFVQATWDETALAAMDAMLYETHSNEQVADGMPSSLMNNLRRMHSSIDESVSSVVGGDGLEVNKDPEARLQYFRSQLAGDKIRKFPALSHFVDIIFAEHDRYISHLKHGVEVSEASLLRDTLRDTVRELASAKQQYLGAMKQNNELKEVVEQLRQVNAKASENQTQLENYVDELRVTLSTFTNQNLRGAPAMRPDTSSKAGFVEAIRRLAKEVEVLREENVKLSEVAASYVETQQVQTAELNAVLNTATQYQSQVAQLKAAIRAMKGYVDELEQRLRELRNVHEENELLRSTVPMQVAKFEREYLNPLELLLPLAQHQFLSQKNVSSLVSPQEYADVGVIPVDEKLVTLVSNRVPQRITVAQHDTEELYDDDDGDCIDSDDLSGGDGGSDAPGSQKGGGGSGTEKTPSSGRSLAPSSVAPSEFMQPTSSLPLHLSTRFGNVKLKQMTVVEVKNMVTELFNDYQSTAEKKTQKDAFHVPMLFEQFAKEWAHRRLKGERVSFEQNMSLFYWCDVYRYRAPEMLMYWKASIGHVSGFIAEVVQASLTSLKNKLQLLEPVTRKQKDRITRDQFLATVKAHLPTLKPLQLEALCATSIHAQEGRFAEDVSYDTFFDRSNTGGLLMYDALARAVISHSEALFLQVEEDVYSALHERNAAVFAKLQRQRDESGSSGTAAIQQMKVESAMAEKCGHAPLRLVAAAVKKVDPHLTHKGLCLVLAIAAGAPELYRTSEGADMDEKLDRMYDVSVLMTNLRKGVTITVSPPPKAPSVEEGSMLARSTLSPTSPDLPARERGSRPPSATIMTAQ